MPDTAIPIPWTPEQRAKMQADGAVVTAAMRAIVTAMQPMAEAARSVTREMIRYAECYIAATRPPADRPAHQSPYGPAHTRRTHK